MIKIRTDEFTYKLSKDRHKVENSKNSKLETREQASLLTYFQHPPLIEY